MPSIEAVGLLSTDEEQETSPKARTWMTSRLATTSVAAALAVAGVGTLAWTRQGQVEPATVNGLLKKFTAAECAAEDADLQPGYGNDYSWRCYGGACIDAQDKCNGVQDCMDGSDEQNCDGGAPVAGGGDPAPAAQAPLSGGCFAQSGYDYSLDWEASGSSFFSEWNYLLNEPNSGGAEYLDANAAYQEGLTQPFPNVAIIKPGGQGSYLKRKSVKMETQRKWTYFLMAMKYEAVPWGCGVWPALWTHSPDVGWPAGGELDILEYSNEITSRSSLHTAESNRCKLNSALLNKPGCPSFTDAEFDFTGNYDCVTSYPVKIGCAPNDRPNMIDGQQMSAEPGVVAVEWTRDFIKVFRIPESQIPQDLSSDAPQPDNWDQWITAYYPFAESEQTVPGSCPNPDRIMAAQRIVLSLGFCGDWAAKVYVNSTCKNVGYPSTGPMSAKGPVMDSECVAVDPHDPKGEQPGGPRDCCTQFIYDKDGSYGTQQYLDEHGAWKINYLKVYQAAQAR